jgi:hypothetical protein
VTGGTTVKLPKTVSLTNRKLQPFTLSPSPSAAPTTTLSLKLRGPAQRIAKLKDAANTRAALRGDVPYALQLGASAKAVTEAGGFDVIAAPKLKVAGGDKATTLEAPSSFAVSFIADGAATVGEGEGRESLFASAALFVHPGVPESPLASLDHHYCQQRHPSARSCRPTRRTVPLYFFFPSVCAGLWRQLPLCCLRHPLWLRALHRWHRWLRPRLPHALPQVQGRRPKVLLTSQQGPGLRQLPCGQRRKR